MKYYAVTDDPRELYHYGVKGMKWGQHIFGDRPKSPGYHKALSKLRSAGKSVKKVANSVQRKVASANQARQERNYKKAVKAAQKRFDLISNMRTFDQEKAYDRQYARDLHNAQKIENANRKAQYKQDKINANYNVWNAKKQTSEDIRDLKNLKKYTRTEKKIDKYIQKARKGTLKYGKLTDDQIQAVQNRLQVESNARKVANTEKTWHQQKKDARRAGKLQGITKGTAAIMEEVARAGAQVGIQNLLNRAKLNSAAKQEGKRQRIQNKERNKKTNSEIKKEIKDNIKKEAYEMAVREGVPGYARNLMNTKESAAMIKRLKDEKHAKEFEQNLYEDRRKRLAQETDNEYYNNRKQIINDKRDKEKFEKAAEMAALYGYVPTSLGGKEANKKENISGLTNYYNLTRKGTNRAIVDAEERARKAEERAKNAEKAAEQRLHDEMEKAREKKREEKLEKDKKKREKKFRKAEEAYEDYDFLKDISGARPPYRKKK